MKMQKAFWSADGDNIHLSMPLCKVDKEARTVSGFATLDNTDSQGDTISREANQRAFSRFKGNVREMHQPIAAGRVVKFKEDQYYDIGTKRQYNGIWVEVYVSKGAQDTWTKVEDGTLSGFSIGGKVLESDSRFVKEANRTVRFVSDYELYELSLVDSPANALANVFSIQKADGVNVVSGLLSDTQAENVFYCKEPDCEVAKTSAEDTLTCPDGHTMDNIGWFEHQGDEAVKTEKVLSIVTEHLSKNSKTEGGVNMEKNTEVTETTEATGATEVAAVAAVVEDAAGENDLNKAIDSLKASLEKGLEKNSQTIATALDELDTKFNTFTKTVVEKLAVIGSAADDITEKIKGLTAGLDGMEKSVKALEDGTAIKKSVDLGGSTESDTTKGSGMWSNAIL